jgi:site-specific recombinase XerD
MPRVNTNKGRKFPPEILTRDEVARLFSGLSLRGAAGIRDRALLTVLYRAGLRISEACGLYPKDVDLANGTIRVLMGKGGKSRTVGIDQGAVPPIARWLDKRRELGISAHRPLFCTIRGADRGRALRPGRVRDKLPQLAAKVGVTKRVHPHAFRHTHAVELLQEGVALPVIQLQLGHSDLSTTARYLAHFGAPELLAAISARSWDSDPSTPVSSARSTIAGSERLISTLPSDDQLSS